MSRFFAPISTSDLETKFQQLGYDEDEDGFNFVKMVENLGKDIKVRFDCENFEYESDNWDKNSLVGHQSFPNGMNFIGCTAGGDWEMPVFFIVYFDGKKLRGYVPTDGNLWNTSSKEAYGNDEDADQKNMEKRECESGDLNWTKIAFDIASRIQPKK